MKHDWEAIESDYRAGLLSIREIAAKFGITDTAIRKRAKKDEWVRDIEAKIQKKADDLVRKREVRGKVRADTECELVKTNAEIVADIRMQHRSDIRRAKETVTKLFSAIDTEDELKLPQKVSSVKHLTDALKTVITLEREAYNIKHDNEESTINVKVGLDSFYADN